MEQLINLFKQNNKELWMVGGAVRDMILGINSHDIDFATNATPSEMLNMKSKLIKVVPTGIDFGTVTFITSNKESFEVTTFRNDVTEGRKPIVAFSTNIADDLSRRDFTFNAIAKNMFNGEFLDLFDGAQDLLDGIIRTVNNPEDRFREDELRMLRAIRFAAKFNFTIEQNTFNAIKKMAKSITNISAERIRQEFLKAAENKNFDIFVQLLVDTNLMKHIMPQVIRMIGLEQNKFHNEDAFNHTLDVIRHMEKNEFNTLKPIDKIIALFHDIGKIVTKSIDENSNVHFLRHEDLGANIAESILKGLKFSNKELELIVAVIKSHMDLKGISTFKASHIRRMINRFSKLFTHEITDNEINSLINLIHSDNNSHTSNDLNFQMLEFVNIMNELKNTNNVKVVRIVNGNDIINEFNIKTGKTIGDILTFADTIVIDNPEITKSELLDLIRSRIHYWI